MSPPDDPELLTPESVADLVEDPQGPRQPLGSRAAAMVTMPPGMPQAMPGAAPHAAPPAVPPGMPHGSGQDGSMWSAWWTNLPEGVVLAICRGNANGRGINGRPLYRAPLLAAQKWGWIDSERCRAFLAENFGPGLYRIIPRDSTTDRLHPACQSMPMDVGGQSLQEEQQQAGPSNPAVDEISDERRSHRDAQARADAELVAANAKKEAAEAEERAARIRIAELEAKAAIEDRRAERAAALKREDDERNRVATLEIRKLELDAAERTAQRQLEADRTKMLLDLTVKANTPAAGAQPFDFSKVMDTILTSQVEGMQRMQRMVLQNSIDLMRERHAPPPPTPPWVDVVSEIGGPIANALALRLGQRPPAAPSTEQPRLTTTRAPISNPPPAATTPAPPDPASIKPAQVQEPSTTKQPVVEPTVQPEVQREQPPPASPATSTAQASMPASADDFIAQQRHFQVGMALQRLCAIQSGLVPDTEDQLEAFIDLLPGDIEDHIANGDQMKVLAAVSPIVMREQALFDWFQSAGVEAWVTGYMGRVRAALNEGED